MTSCYERRSVGQSVLVSGTHLRPMTRIFITVKTAASSLTRGWVCKLLLGLSFCPRDLPTENILLFFHCWKRHCCSNCLATCAYVTVYWMWHSAVLYIVTKLRRNLSLLFQCLKSWTAALLSRWYTSVNLHIWWYKKAVTLRYIFYLFI
jgi:hypothetical protein